MGLKSEWMRLVEVALIAEDIEVQQLNHEYFYLLSCLDRTLIINLIPIDNHFLPLQLVEFQELSQHSNIQVINLWEDVFKSKNKQVISRIRSIVGYNQKFMVGKLKLLKFLLLMQTCF